MTLVFLIFVKDLIKKLFLHAERRLIYNIHFVSHVLIIDVLILLIIISFCGLSFFRFTSIKSCGCSTHYNSTSSWPILRLSSRLEAQECVQSRRLSLPKLLRAEASSCY
jgi:hypothetical protein